MPEPRVIYQPKPGTPIDVDREFYGRLGRETDSRSLVDQFVVPMRSGRAWPVLAGQICRIVVVEGRAGGRLQRVEPEQPAGTVLGGAHQATAPRPRVHVRPAVVVPAVPAAHAHHYGRHGRLSPGRGRRGMPRPAGHALRPVRPQDAERRGFRLLLPFEPGAGGRSVPPERERRSRRAEHLPGHGPDARRPILRETVARQTGRLFEFFAEIDLLCAISTCPHGDLSVQVWGEDAGDPIDTCHPLGVEIYQPHAELLEGWQSPPTVDYQGIHGLDRP